MNGKNKWLNFIMRQGSLLKPNLTRVKRQKPIKTKGKRRKKIKVLGTTVLKTKNHPCSETLGKLSMISEIKSCKCKLQMK